MADFEPDPGPPQSAADVLSPPAPPFHPVQSVFSQLSNANPPTDHQKDVKTPGTQLHATSYGTLFLPHMNIDHDSYNRSTYGISATVIQCPTGHINHRQSTFGKITPEMTRNPATSPQSHPSNQIDVRPQDDRTTKITMNHAIAEPHTTVAWMLHPPRCTTRRIDEKKNATIVTDQIEPSNLLSGNTPADNDPNDGTIIIPSNTRANPRDATLPLTCPQTCSHLFPSAVPAKSPDIFHTMQIISMQLAYLEKCIRAIQSGSTPPPIPPELHNSHPSVTQANQQFPDNPTDPTIQDGTAPTSRENNQPMPTKYDHEKSDTNQCDKASPHNQRANHLPTHLKLSTNGASTTNQPGPPTCITHEPDSRFLQHPCLASAKWNPSVAPHLAVPSPSPHTAHATHANPSFTTTTPTFAQWCAEHLTLNCPTRRLMANRKRIDSLLLLASSGTKPTNNIKPHPKIRKKLDPHSPAIPPTTCTNPYHLEHHHKSAIHVTIVAPVCQLPSNSTQRRHHVRFRTQPHHALQMGTPPVKYHLRTHTETYDTYTTALRPSLSTCRDPTQLNQPRISGSLLIFRRSQNITKDLLPP